MIVLPCRAPLMTTFEAPSMMPHGCSFGCIWGAFQQLVILSIFLFMLGHFRVTGEHGFYTHPSAPKALLNNVPGLQDLKWDGSGTSV